MEESQKRKATTSDEIIAAYDREREEAHESRRRYAEQLRELRAQDRPIYIERRRRPR